MDYKLILKTNFIEDLEIKLFKNSQSNLFDNTNIVGIIYSDREYKFDIIFNEYNEEIEEIELYINNNKVDCYYSNNEIFLNSKKRIFIDYFGYVMFTVKIKTSHDMIELHSKYLEVAIRNNISNESIRSMIEYIYKNSPKYLTKCKDSIKDFSDTFKGERNGLEYEISILEKILSEYEKNMKYFKCDSKYKISSLNIVDDFEKLRHIKSETLQYIVSNPQLLTTVNYNTGISYNGTNLQPIKTLVNKNNISYDIYENKIILGFLKTIYNSIDDKINFLDLEIMKKTVSNIKSGYTILIKEVNENFFKKKFQVYKVKLINIKKSIEKIYFIYKSIFNCEEILIEKLPKPSSIFINIEHYRRIYNVMVQWFEFGGYNFENEKLLLSLLKSSKIYEYYVLLNIANNIQKNKFLLKESEKFQYSVNKNSLYNNTDFENTFKFKRGNKEIVLYYQPVVHWNKSENSIGLFRNTNIGLDGNLGTYYTPDYIIKKTNNGVSEYSILDAKWSTKESIIKYMLMDTVYKYCFSISTIDKNDILNEVLLINGKESIDEENSIYNIFNSKFKQRNSELLPQVKILTLNPNINQLKLNSDIIDLI